ncbi:MAG TPA: hypothetical protein VMJ32_13495 [Pirellulales bacterium]|nr:hypothetical protein [Pirellulales bacterium]
MNTAYEKLLSRMKQLQIGHWSNDEQQAICVDFPGIVGSYRVFARINNEVGQFQATGQLRLCVSKGCQSGVVESIRLVNSALPCGGFEMNFETSELRFETAETLLGDRLENETVDRLIGMTREAFDIYLPAILSVIYGNELPSDALQQVEALRIK